MATFSSAAAYGFLGNYNLLNEVNFAWGTQGLGDFIFLCSVSEVISMSNLKDLAACRLLGCMKLCWEAVNTKSQNSLPLSSYPQIVSARRERTVISQSTANQRFQIPREQADAGRGPKKCPTRTEY